MKKPSVYVIVREIKEKDWKKRGKVGKRLLFHLLPVLISGAVVLPAEETVLRWLTDSLPIRGD